ncbi:hypothetical protein L210DRAFT_3551311, partial [Boletus edulis BED1]
MLPVRVLWWNCLLGVHWMRIVCGWTGGCLMQRICDLTLARTMTAFSLNSIFWIFFL